MAGRAKRHKRRMIAEINVVPYIDVMLVLLVIFMVTAPMMTPGVPIDLPEVSSEPLPVDENDEPLVISMNRAGELFINVGGDETVAVSLETIGDRVTRVLSAKPSTFVQLRSDTGLEYGAVMEVMGVLQASGVTSIGLVAETP